MDHQSLTPASTDGLPHSPAAERNAEPILAVLREWLPPAGRVLEIAGGTGQHAVYFARALAPIEWQPSDCDGEALAALRTRIERADLPNLEQPLQLDVCAGEWPIETAAAIVCINLTHIAPWTATQGLMAGAARLLPAGGPLLIYGPFRHNGRHTAPSNARFDQQLRSRDARWGIRDDAAVTDCAREHGLTHAATNDLPANNRMLVFQR